MACSLAYVSVGLQIDSLFRINHTDPWVGGDAHRTSRTINFQNTRTSGNAVHGRAQDEVDRPPGGAAPPAGEEPGADGNVIVARLTRGVEYARPLATGACCAGGYILACLLVKISSVAQVTHAAAVLFCLMPFGFTNQPLPFVE